MEIDAPFAKVPCECVSQVFRKTRKQVCMDLQGVLKEVQRLAPGKDKDTLECSHNPSIPTSEGSTAGDNGRARGRVPGDDEVDMAVDSSVDPREKVAELIARLAKLRVLVEEAGREETKHLSNLGNRLHHLARTAAASSSHLSEGSATRAPALGGGPGAGVTPGSGGGAVEGSGCTGSSKSECDSGGGRGNKARVCVGGVSGGCEGSWEHTRLDRCIVEYMMRKGLFDAACHMAEETGVQDCEAIDLFQKARVVQDGLMEHDLGPALQWCADNSSKLRKLDSRLEFRLQKRAFLEKVRANEKAKAILYAQENLGMTHASHENVYEIQEAMATLAFEDPANAPVKEYAALFAEERWAELASAFLEEMLLVYGFTRVPMLELVLQDEHRVETCPTCSDEGRVLGHDLPVAHHAHSSLMCRQSGEPMDEDNPPLALPNGRVYSSRSLRAMAGQLGGGGMVTCTYTGQTFRFDQLRNVFII